MVTLDQRHRKMMKEADDAMAKAYVTLKECSDQHLVGCDCKTCKFVDDYEADNGLTEPDHDSQDSKML